MVTLHISKEYANRMKDNSHAIYNCCSRRQQHQPNPDTNHVSFKNIFPWFYRFTDFQKIGIFKHKYEGL